MRCARVYITVRESWRIFPLCPCPHASVLSLSVWLQNVLVGMFMGYVTGQADPNSAINVVGDAFVNQVSLDSYI